MFRVECSSCRAPYQVDERRVPKKGLTMKCPKCQASFLVSPPDMPQPEVAKPAVSLPRTDLRGTMIGVSVQGRGDQTMIGISAPKVGRAKGADPSPPFGAKSEQAAVPRSTPEDDLPVRRASSDGIPVAPLSLRTSSGSTRAGQLPPEPPPNVSRAANTKDTAAELPALRRESAGKTGVGFTTLASKKVSRINLPSLQSKPIGSGGASSIPAPPVQSKPPKALGAESGALPDLPAVKNIRSTSTQASTPTQGVASQQPHAFTTSPPSARSLYKPTTPELSLSLSDSSDEGDLFSAPQRPVAAGPKSQSSDDDLPMALGSKASSGANPSFTANSSGRGAVDELSLDLDLPSPTSSTVSAPPSSNNGDLPTLQKGGGSDLPAALGGSNSPALGGSDLPAALGGFGGGWPSQAPKKDERPPATARVAHDSLVDLDSEGVSLESLPPSVPLDDGPDLPEVALDSNLPRAQGYSALPAKPANGFEADAGLGFGELDLPPLDFKLTGPTSGQSANPPPRARSPHPSEPPDLHQSSAPPSFRARQDSFGDFDGLPSFEDGQSAPPPNPSHVSEGDELEDDLFGDHSLSLGDGASDRVSSPPASHGALDSRRGAVALGSQMNGSAGRSKAVTEEYGEVNLDSGSHASGELSAADDGMEFGGIPQAESEPPAAPNVAANAAGTLAIEAPVVQNRDVHVPSEPGEKAKQGKSRRKLGFAMAAVVAVAVGGGALSLDARLGPFGVHAIEGLLKQGEHQALLAKHDAEVLEQRALDQYAGALKAVGSLAQARSSAKRFVPLQVATAQAQLSLVLRFGGPAEVQSAGQVLLGELRAADPELPQLRLASALNLILNGEPDKATRILNSLPKDLVVLTTDGERLLLAEEGDNAVAVWNQAVQLKRCPWTLFGLARAQFISGQLEPARASARQVLEGNSLHAGAKLLLVQIALSEGQADSTASGLLDEVLRDATLLSRAELTLTHTLRGEIELSRGRAGKALEGLEEALQLDPNNARALTSSAVALFSSGRYAAALARFQTAQTGSPKAVGPVLGVARSQVALEQLDKAKLTIEPLLKSHPNDLEVATVAGSVLLAEGNVDEARTALLKALQAAKDQPRPTRLTEPAYQRVRVEAYVLLAASFLKAGQPDKATPILQEAMKELPRSAALRVALGDVAVSQGQYDKALADYSEARQLAPEGIEAVFKVGSTLRRLGRFDEATSVFERVAKMDPEYPGLALERGLLLEQQGKAKEALEQFENALKKTPDDQDIQLRVGCGRMSAGNGEAAEKILQDVIKSRPKSAEANYCLGRAMFVLGNQLEALRWLRSAVELDGNRAEYRLYVGWVAGQLGQVALASKELNKALELDQGLADAYWQRGVLNLRQGAARDALYDFKKTLELKPDRYEANADLAQALTQLTREGEAIGYWEKALAGDSDNALWLFRYGKLLVGKRQNAKGTTLLLKSIDLASKQEPKPVWLGEAHYQAAVALGSSSDAVPHWKAFLDSAPSSSPLRAEALRFLARAGQPYEGP